MQPAALAALALMVLALAGLLVGETRGPRRLVWWTKPLASACFVALPFLWGGPQGAAGWLIVGGLALAAVGDVLLIPASTTAFRAAIVVVLLAHVAYAAAFVLLGVDPARVVGAAILLAIAGALLARWFMPRVPAPLKPAVAAYVLVITLMAVLALGSGWVAALPALAFYLSDVTVARHRFVAAEPLNRLVGLPLYYAGQVGFAALAAMILR